MRNLVKTISFKQLIIALIPTILKTHKRLVVRVWKLKIELIIVSLKVFNFVKEEKINTYLTFLNNLPDGHWKNINILHYCTIKIYVLTFRTLRKNIAGVRWSL